MALPPPQNDYDFSGPLYKGNVSSTVRVSKAWNHLRCENAKPEREFHRVVLRYMTDIAKDNQGSNGLRAHVSGTDPTSTRDHTTGAIKNERATEVIS